MPWAIPLLVWLAASSASPANVSCIRIADVRQRHLLDDGVTRSATFARVASDLCRTDAIVYVELSLTMPRQVGGTCQLVVSTPHRRFLRVYLNARHLNRAEMIAVLGHELEHALQIGRAPWVRVPRDVLTLQRVVAPGQQHSPEADRVQEHVLREVLAGHRPGRDRDARLASASTDQLACGRAGDAPCSGSTVSAESVAWQAASNQGRTRSMVK